MPGEYYLLDSITGWRALRPPEQLVLDDPQGMHLRPLPGKPDALIDPAGTFGGMETPTGIAVDAAGRVYASDAACHLIWRFDPCTKTWEPVPSMGGQGTEPRQFNEPRGLALSPEGDLYVADSGNHRVQMFNLKGLVLRAIWGKAAGDKPGEFNQPWDVAVDSRENVYVADKGNGRVQKWDRRARRFHVFDGTRFKAHFFLVLYGAFARHRFVYVPARNRLEHWRAGDSADREEVKEEITLTSVDAARLAVLRRIDALGATDILHEWQGEYPLEMDKEPFIAPTHLAIDREDRLYVVDEEKDYVKILDTKGRVLGRVTIPEELGGRFQPAAVTVDEQDFVLVADREGKLIYRFRPHEGRCEQAGCCLGFRGDCPALATDPEGNLLAADGGQGGIVQMRPGAGFEKSGEYRSQALDSDIEGCRWHRIVLDYARMATDTQVTNTEEKAGPPGAKIDVPPLVPTGTSVTVWTYTSEVKRADDEITGLPEDAWQTAQTNARDFLIQSPPGRYLWLRIRFEGNGTDTPVIRRLKVFFPRASSLQHLPAVYQQDEVGRGILDRFLSLTDSMFESIESQVDDFVRYLDADGTPDNFLNWLGGWLALSFEGKWTPGQKRELIRRAPELFRKRGTLEGLKEYLRIYTGCEAHILEHFVLRRWLFLATDGTLGRQSALWGHGIVRRLQLEENSRIGDFRLVSTGDPQRDPFHVFAHKFSVFIPAACLDTKVKEGTLRRLIEQEKPAYTQAFLVKLEPRFRVAVQSTVGIDTMLGDYPRLILPAVEDPDALTGNDQPPIPGTGATLGSDTLLGQAPERRGPSMTQVGPARVGVSTVVA